MAKNDRRKHEPRHVRLYHQLLDTEAWRHLSGNGVKLLLQLAKYETGKNNGSLFMSCRRAAAEIGVSINTVSAAFKELEGMGFVQAVERGHFDRKTSEATSWRLTWLPVPNRRAPTHEYKDWQPMSKKHGLKNYDRTVSKIDTAPPKSTATVSKIATATHANPPKQQNCAVSNIDTQTVCHWGSETAGRLEGDETQAGDARGLPFKLVPIAEVVDDLARRMELAEAA